MKIKALLNAYYLLGTIILAFSISMILSFNNIRKYEQLAQSEITDTVWIVAQAELELVRFLYTLDLYMYADPPAVDKEDVIERMELFWSRLPMFLEGREGRRLSTIGNTRETAQSAMRVLNRLEPALVGLQRADRETYNEIRSELHGLLAPLKRTLVDAQQWQEAATGIRGEQLDRVYVELIVASVGILLSGGCLIMLLLHETRQTRRARASEKRALTRLSDAIESFADGFTLFDRDGRLVMCNEQYKQMHAAVADKLKPGITLESIIRTYVENGLVPDAVGQEEEWIQQRITRHRQPAKDFEIRFRDGRWFRISERRTSDGGCVSIHSDISALKRRQEDLKSQQREADNANKAKTDFLLTMSHELRTPLNAIMGFSEVMKQQMRGPLGDESYVDYANDIYESARHLLAVINNILDISRIEAGRLELDEQAVTIGNEVSKALRLFRDEARVADIELTASIEKDLPLLLGDPHKIQQIAINLVGNAIRYMPGDGRVAVDARRGSDGGIILSVKDDGAGMSADDLERVISPFVRLSNPMVRQHDGTGLGLPLVKALVELHGGTFELESTPGTGTIATAQFPKTRVLSSEPSFAEDRPAGLA